MSIEYKFRANIDQVFALLTDAEYLVDRCLELGELSADCTVEDDNDEIVITLSREVERNLPSFLARLFDSRQKIEMIERWKDKGNIRHGSYVLKVEGQPIVLEAEMHLKADGNDSCTYTISHSAKAQMPLIGRRVESFIVSQTESGARAELDDCWPTLGNAGGEVVRRTQRGSRGRVR